MGKLKLQNGYLPSSAWEQDMTRKGYADALVELGAEDKRVVVLDADLSQSTLTKFFAAEYPERFFECGISEADMVNTAAGLSKMGFVPFLSSYAMFLAGRAWDQIRNTVDYSYCNVKIGSAHGGITVGKDGPTHQSMEDISNMQSLVNMGMIVPADYHECHKCTKTIAALEGPMYMRMGREKIPTLTSEDTPFEFGKAQPVASGTDGTIIGYGVMLQYCIMAAELLADEGIYPRVLNMATIKPLDVEALLEAAGETGGIVVAEEHSIYGALGSTVARVIAESDVLVPFKGVAIRDMYLSSGDPVELMDLAGLNVEGIVDALKDVLKRGKRG